MSDNNSSLYAGDDPADAVPDDFQGGSSLREQLNELQIPGLGVGDCFVIGKQTLIDFVTSYIEAAEIEAQIKELNQWLSRDKISTLDIKMRVHDLQAQKAVLEEKYA